uniref:Reverse transcriptase domain-containing protein n=1 Tax=Naja naja TaxID=35670 RepID=A0A8C6VP90_NAJNA
MRRLSSTTCLLDPCPSWLVYASREVTCGWLWAVVNASLREGAFTAALKEAVVRPLLKKPALDPAELNNFRPVSNLRFLAKVVKSVVAQQFPLFLEEADYLDPYQLGFRPGYSTERALVALMDDLLRARDRGFSSVLVLLDLSAAFNTIDHGILLRRLGGLGVGGTVLQWFASFLSGRLQSVLAGGQRSAPRALTCGVPQGSVLSPLLFNIYMKPLGEIIRGFGVKYHQYADDTQLYISTPGRISDALSVMSRCLDAVRTWMDSNMLRLNLAKTEWLCIQTSRPSQEIPSLVMGGEVLPPHGQGTESGGPPGLTAQVGGAGGSRGQGGLCPGPAGLPVTPISGPRCPTHGHSGTCHLATRLLQRYLGLPLHTIRRLQLVQNAAARVVMGVSRFSHVTPLLRGLHWLPVALRMRFKVLVLTFKVLRDMGPGYLRERLLPASNTNRPV